jgi:hypothetical protein
MALLGRHRSPGLEKGRIVVNAGLRKWVGWLSLLAGLAALAAWILVFEIITLPHGKPIRITFEPGEPSARGELNLVFGNADYALQACCEGSTFLARDPKRGGSVVRGFRTRPTDQHVKGNFRSELRLRPNAVGETVWYRASVLVPRDWKPSKVPVIAMQWHGSKDFFLGEPGKYPPLDISIRGDRWHITKSWDHRILTTKTPTGNVEGMAELGQVPLTRGHWVTWTVRVHWSSTAAGSTEIWLDGRKIVNDHGPNAHRDLIGPYLKAGSYVPGWGYSGAEPAIRERTLLFDDIAVDYGTDPFRIGYRE